MRTFSFGGGGGSGLYINRASHHGASVQGLLHDREQVVWSFLGFVYFPHTAGKILHGLQCAAALQGLVAAVQSKINRATHHCGQHGVNKVIESKAKLTNLFVFRQLNSVSKQSHFKTVDIHVPQEINPESFSSL